MHKITRNVEGWEWGNGKAEEWGKQSIKCTYSHGINGFKCGRRVRPNKKYMGDIKR